PTPVRRQWSGASGLLLQLTHELLEIVGAADVAKLHLHSGIRGGGKIDGAKAEEAFETALVNIDAADIADADLTGTAADNAPDDFDALIRDEAVMGESSYGDAGQGDGASAKGDKKVLAADDEEHPGCNREKDGEEERLGVSEPGGMRVVEDTFATVCVAGGVRIRVGIGFELFRARKSSSASRGESARIS
ncbi:MAG TPA: hypothetical protein VD994_06945, partial [Prosthecobacter sp.]|nr:hypothetical protein [Prosthecobacter sp.]